jgi:TolB-like protein/Flp pilus assembly protein TadD
LERILASRVFWHAEGLSRFLRYVVEETLAGRAEAIKEYSIGLAVFDRGASFDPKADTIVRVQARRLRAKLTEFYKTNGDASAVTIELHKGTYVPVFISLPRVSDEQHEPPRGGKRRLFRGGPVLIIGAALLVAAVMVAAFWREKLLSRYAAFEAIAILPFESLSTDADQRYLADGLTEALITNLGQTCPIRVIGRTSINQYRGTKKPIREIARELNVDVVVEGAIAHSGERLRVTVNLIQVSPEKHLWARSYERNLGDVLALQNEIAGAIGAEIQLKLTPRQHARLQNSRPVRPEAQLAYWKALYFLQVRRDRESAAKSVEYSEKAVRIDSNYAPAQAALARSYLMFSNLGGAFPRELAAQAKAAAQSAIALDEDLAEARVALGSILLAYDWDWAGAEREARRAISLNPSNADARLLLANYLAAVGRVDEAVVEIKRARELDPFSFYIQRNVGRLLYFARKYDEALTELHQAADMQPNSPTVGAWIARSYLNKGMIAEAVAAEFRTRSASYGLDAASQDAVRAAYSANGLPGFWKKLKELLLARTTRRDTVHASYHLAEISALAGEIDEAFRWLEKAYQERTGHMPWIKVTPSLDVLRPDQRFDYLLRRMGLPPSNPRKRKGAPQYRRVHGAR